MSLKHLYLVICGFLCTIWAFGQAEPDLALDAYSKGDFKQAISLYEEMLKQGEAAALYYNLGNAYYKDNQVAKAILNYERALLINPGMSDARFNLEMAQQKVIDKIEPLDTFFLVAWKNAVRDSVNMTTWAALAISFFLLFIASVLAFSFIRIVWVKKLSFFAGIVLIVCCVVANVFAADLKEKQIDRKGGIILAPTVTVKSSPDQSGNDLFILHEGTKVYLRSTLGDWSEIVLDNGNVGWLPSRAFETI